MINKILFDNDILIQTKRNMLPIIYGITNSIFLIEVLLLLNYVNSSVNLGQGIIYERVILFYNIIIMTLFLFVYILTPIYSAGSITNMYNDNKLINLVVAGISPKDIIIEKVIFGIMNVIFSVIVALPIGYVSLFFGGINIIKILMILCILLFYIISYNMFCVMISTYNNNIFISYIVSYLIGLVFIITLLLLLNILVSNIIAFIIYILISILLTIFLYLLATEGTIFKNY